MNYRDSKGIVRKVIQLHYSKTREVFVALIGDTEIREVHEVPFENAPEEWKVRYDNTEDYIIYEGEWT